MGSSLHTTALRPATGGQQSAIFGATTTIDPGAARLSLRAKRRGFFAGNEISADQAMVHVNEMMTELILPD